MLSKRYKPIKPTTASLRNTKLINREFLWKGKPIKDKVKGLHRTGGRNNVGRTTTFHRGGGHKRSYRNIGSLKRYTFYGDVYSIEHDPFRSSFIFSCYQKETGGVFYLLAPQNLNVKDKIYSGHKPTKFTVGSYMPLFAIPIGSLIYNVELFEGKGPQYIKAAGTFGKLLRKDPKTRTGELTLPSGEKVYCSLNCYASLGVTSSIGKRYIQVGKAGRNRWIGKKPTVRGIAMNPCDHPHGGGNGVSTPAKGCRTPWGKVTKGQPTRNKKKKSKQVIKSRKQL